MCVCILTMAHPFALYCLPGMMDIPKLQQNATQRLHVSQPIRTVNLHNVNIVWAMSFIWKKQQM